MRDFKVSGTFAKLHKPILADGFSICSRNAIGNVQARSFLSLSGFPSFPPNLISFGREKPKKTNSNRVPLWVFRSLFLQSARFSPSRVNNMQAFHFPQTIWSARRWGAAKICREKNAIRSPPQLERQESKVREGRNMFSGKYFHRRHLPQLDLW